MYMLSLSKAGELTQEQAIENVYAVEDLIHAPIKSMLTASLEISQLINVMHSEIDEENLVYHLRKIEKSSSENGLAISVVSQVYLLYISILSDISVFFHTDF